ncbi:MAG: DsbA family protein, partial [Acidobacteriota bacterium]
AQAQGKFWEYHDLLFENQTNLEREDLESYAEEVELDMDRFRRELDEHTHAKTVNEDIADGRAVGVSGTPTIFINEARYTGPYSLDALQQAIDNARQG